MRLLSDLPFHPVELLAPGTALARGVVRAASVSGAYDTGHLRLVAALEQYRLATYASEEGFAVAQSEWDVSAVKDCGRVLEKSRWRLGAAQARSHAQLTGGVDFESHAIVDEMRALRLDRWEHVSDFPEVPPGRLAASSWKLVRYGRWRFSDGILRLEARALERGVSRFAQFKLGRDIRVLSLCDNMAVTLAVGPSRAKDFGLLV